MRGPFAVTHLSRSLILGTSILALAACGPEDLGSPGANGDINIGDIIIDNSTTNPPAPTPTPTGTALVTPAANCPTLSGTAAQLTANGTITGDEGTWLVCTLPTLFTDSTKLERVDGVVYEMAGRVDVGTDDGPNATNSDGITGNKVTLTIDPGVILFGRDGAPGGAYIVVQRGSKLMADGTEEMPIIFTAEKNVTSEVTDFSSGLWGGVVLLGRAPVSDCYLGNFNPTNREECFMQIEGIADNVPVFGGNTADDSSGSVSYVQIRYSGYIIAPGNELQSLTLGGVGSGTNLHHIQSYNSSDDGTEWFGGSVNMKYFVAVGAEDDSVDVDAGVQGNLQYAAIIQREGYAKDRGDKAVEVDSPNAEKDWTPNTNLPRTNMQISNFSFWAVSASSANPDTRVTQTRGGGNLTLANGVIYKPYGGTGQTRSCIADDGEQGGDGSASFPRTNSTIILYSVELDCNVDTRTQTAIDAGSGNKVQTNTLSGKYLNGDNEQDFTPVYNTLAPSTFFDASTVIGSVPRPAGSEVPWTRGWTCDSAIVSFGSGASCKSLPVY
jgi:hypothetical protein